MYLCQKSVWVLCLLGSYALCGSQPLLQAQQPDVKRYPTYGKVTLKAGFQPDPYVKGVAAGGSLRTSLGNVNSYVRPGPDYELNYTKGKFPLFFYIEAKKDTTLVVYLPNGKWIANDDDLGNNNPLIHIPQPESGRYLIFCGTFEEDSARTLVDLKISEIDPRKR